MRKRAAGSARRIACWFERFLLVGVLMRAASARKVFPLQRIGVWIVPALVALSLLRQEAASAESPASSLTVSQANAHRALLCGPIDSTDIGELLPSFEYTHATPARSMSTDELFTEVVDAYGERGLELDPELIIEDGEFANAFVRGDDAIVVTTQLVDTVHDRSELAFILAHEIAHMALKHAHGYGIQGEIDADRLALEVVTSLGFNPCAGAQVLDRLSAPLSASLVSVAPRLHALHQSTPAQCG